ncbi:MAG: 4-hydroxybenzoate 3-monooxygenase [Ilumatobacteraceae bacterium]
MAFNGRRHRLDFVDLVGTSITVYGQQEVVKDLIAARLAAGDPIVFEALDVTLEGLAAPNDLDGDRPVVRYRHGGREHELRCQVIAGCDGFHGISRDHVAGLATATRDYPFAWLGILAEAAPTIDELIYSNHERGFALYSMRSPTITRMYLQVAADEQLDTWSDDRIWSEFDERLPTGDDFALNTGPIIERGITAMRSVVATPMRHGRLLLAGDAAHIVPPTGAKGMNLAIADVAVMAQVLDAALNKGDSAALERYTETCLTRVWRAQHFSWWMTSMLHRFGDDPFQRELQLSELGARHDEHGGGDEPRPELRRSPVRHPPMSDDDVRRAAIASDDRDSFAPAPAGTHAPLDSPSTARPRCDIPRMRPCDSIPRRRTPPSSPARSSATTP